MSKFKIGDIVTGTKTASNYYRITAEGWTGKVISADSVRITVADSSGTHRFEVSACDFRLATEEEKIKAGFKGPNHVSKTTKNVDKNVETIKNVIFNAPATIVLWSDGTKTVVKCGEGEKYDPEKGLALCIAKKALGNNHDYYEPFKKYLGKYHKKESKKMPAKKPVAPKAKTKKPVAKKTGTRKSAPKK